MRFFQGYHGNGLPDRGQTKKQLFWARSGPTCKILARLDHPSGLAGCPKNTHRQTEFVRIMLIFPDHATSLTADGRDPGHSFLNGNPAYWEKSRNIFRRSRIGLSNENRTKLLSEKFTEQWLLACHLSFRIFNFTSQSSKLKGCQRKIFRGYRKILKTLLKENFVLYTTISL